MKAPAIFLIALVVVGFAVLVNMVNSYNDRQMAELNKELQACIAKKGNPVLSQEYNYLTDTLSINLDCK